MNVELLIRQGLDAKKWRHAGRGADDHGIRVRATHAWFEGPDDMHIHLRGFHCPLRPLYCEHTGDYIIPDPSGAGFVLCYQIMLMPAKKKVAPIPDATPEYALRLAQTWDFLNDLMWPISKADARRLKQFRKHLEEYSK